MFSCEFCETLRTFFTEHLRTMASGQIGHIPKFKSVADVSSDLLGLFELIYIYLTSNLVQPILAYVCHTSLVFFYSILLGSI